MNQLISKGRWKQMRGSIHKMWGKLTHYPGAEFLGEQNIMEGKLEEYYAGRCSDFRDARRPVRSDEKLHTRQARHGSARVRLLLRVVVPDSGRCLDWRRSDGVA